MKNAAHLCVARHGETDWNVIGILQGWIDVPLNDNGRRQALEMVESLRDAGFARIYSSPLSRAMETATLIAAALKLPPPLACDAIKERHFGQVQGVPKSILAKSHPQIAEQIVARNPACHFEGGESMTHFASRILDGLKTIADESRGENVLIITHGWVMDVITRHVNKLPLDTILNMKRKNMECVWLEANHDEIIPLDDPSWDSIGR